MDSPIQGQNAAAWQRAYILGVLSFGSFAQSLDWFTFSSVDAAKFQVYYRGAALPEDADKDAATFQVRLLLNWGPFVGVLFFPFAAWLLTQPNGLRWSVLLGLGTTAAGSVLRLLPSLSASSPLNLPKHAVPLAGSELLTLSILHISQLLIGVGGPFVMGCVSRLAVVWFPEDQRVSATAIGATSNSLGVTIGFLLGPWLVPAAERYCNLLLVCAACSILPFVCALVYYPNAPRRPPSAAAAVWAEVDEEPGGGFMEGLRLACSNIQYGALVLSAGVLSGSGAAWQAILQDTLAPVGYSDTFIGYLGFANSLGLNLGAVAAGAAAGTKPLRRRFKLALVLGVGSILVSGVVWSVVCTKPDIGVLLITLVGIMGLGNGVANPFYYELGAELTFPAPEGTSAGILVCIWNLTTLAIVFLPASLHGSMNWIYLAVVLFCLLLIFFVKEKYKRPTNDDDSAAHNASVAEAAGLGRRLAGSQVSAECGSL